MPDEKPGDAVQLGKKFAGEKFPTVRAVDQTEAQLQTYANADDAIPIEAYFASVRVTDDVRKAMMLVHTKIRKAPRSVFDTVFETF